MAHVKTPQQQIMENWRRLGGSWLGRHAFSRMIGLFVPYSGSISPFVIELGEGTVKIQVKDRRAIRNHLRSVHAIALANMGELASGLAMMSVLPNNCRAIVTHLEIDYLKKARGVLSVIGEATLPDDIGEETEIIVNADIFNAENELLATLRVTWQVGPIPVKT